MMISTAIKEVFSEKKSFLWAALGSIFFFFLYVYPPIFLTPGNSFSFFIKSTPVWGFITIGILSTLMGILAAMHTFLWKTAKTFSSKNIAATLGVSASSMITGLFSSATCITCVSTLLSFILPPTGILFLFDYRGWITGAGIILIVISIFNASSHIVKGCITCSVHDMHQKEATNQRQQSAPQHNKADTYLS